MSWRHGVVLVGCVAILLPVPEASPAPPEVIYHNGVVSAHRTGWQVSAHTISAEAHDQYLTAVARAQAIHPNPDARHRVEHVIQLRDDQLTMIGELGMIASIQYADYHTDRPRAKAQVLVSKHAKPGTHDQFPCSIAVRSRSA